MEDNSELMSWYKEYKRQRNKKIAITVAVILVISLVIGLVWHIYVKADKPAKKTASQSNSQSGDHDGNVDTLAKKIVAACEVASTTEEAVSGESYNVYMTDAGNAAFSFISSDITESPNILASFECISNQIEGSDTLGLIRKMYDNIGQSGHTILNYQDIPDLEEFPFEPLFGNASFRCVYSELGYMYSCEFADADKANTTGASNDSASDNAANDTDSGSASSSSGSKVMTARLRQPMSSAIRHIPVTSVRRITGGSSRI